MTTVPERVQTAPIQTADIPRRDAGLAETPRRAAVAAQPVHGVLDDSSSRGVTDAQANRAVVGGASSRAAGGRAAVGGASPQALGGRAARRAAIDQSPRGVVAVRRRPAVIIIVVLAVIAAVAAVGGGTYAWWLSSAHQSGAAIQSGDLRLTVDDDNITWVQVTPGVAQSDAAHGTLTSTPTNFLSQPGDVIRIVAPVTTLLKGDNLQGALTAQYDDAVTPDPDLNVTFHIEDTSGTQVAPASGEATLGDSVVVPNLVGDDAGVQATWNVVVTVVVGGQYVWAGDPTGQSRPTTGGSWTVGTLDFKLLQVRGAGTVEDSTVGGS